MAVTEVDVELTGRLLARRTEGVEGSSDVGHVMRYTGLKALRLPGGESVLGWDHGDGTWGVLAPVGSLDGGETRGAEWHAGRVDGASGRGFTTRSPATLVAALREALVMPSPLSPDGPPAEALVDDAVEAEAVLDDVRHAPAPGM